MYALIAPDDTMLMWMVVVGVVAIAITCEQRVRWASRINSTVQCILFGLVLANLRILPFSSPMFSNIDSFLLPLAMPLLLFKSDMRRIMRESGVTFLIFNITALAVFVGTLAFPLIFPNTPYIEEYAAMHVGANIGGTVNATMLAQIFAVPTEMVVGLAIAGNFFVGLMIIVLGLMYRTKFFKKHLTYGDEGNSEDVEGAATAAAAYWSSKGGISFKDIPQAMAITFAIVGFSTIIARIVNATEPSFFVGQIFGNIWILMTLITTILATILPKQLGNIRGSDELGSIILLTWFVTIGARADLNLIFGSASLVIAAYTMTFIIACVVVFIIGKFFKFHLENMMCCIAASVGGPGTVAALCVSMRWTKWIVPGVLMALYGVIIGNFAGILVGNILGAAPFGG